MSTTLNNIFADYSQNIEKRLSADVAYHFIFWLAFFFFLVIFHRASDPLAIKMLDGVIHIAFYSIIVYTNIYYLFRRFIKDGNIISYILLLTTLVVVISPMKSVAVYGLELENHLYSSFLGCFFIASMSSIYLIFNDWYRQKNEQAHLQQQNLKSELNFLKTQINPHFLFNTLNSLYALTLKKSDDAPNIVLRLSEMMRYMLYECNERKVDLKKEINYLNNYLELEKIRHSGKFEINFNVEGDVHQQKIAPLLFIPFVENSFKHGVNTLIKNGFVNINLKVAQQKIHLEVENSKAPQMPRKNPKKSGGIGLVNVKKRLGLIYPKKHELEISNNPNSYKINLTLEL